MKLQTNVNIFYQTFSWVGNKFTEMTENTDFDVDTRYLLWYLLDTYCIFYNY